MSPHAPGWTARRGSGARPGRRPGTGPGGSRGAPASAWAAAGTRPPPGAGPAAPPGHEPDRGSGAVLVIALVAVSVLLAAALGLLVAAQGARGRARTAADLGALAASERLLAGAGDGCGLAGEVAARNGATLQACTQHGGAVVTVRAAVALPWGTAVAEARAGPRGASVASG
ncbi:Rv3654c family TadE-like protein [Cellulomonas hominis]|uniref:Rv3654c family TadE-like protein n=1 Tax=Cellulomonas hominis TaxID=156981 RepID=UPI0014447B9D|nr:flp pilus-assembly TadE/G-like family protein [Cellulomonas hominis]